MPGSDPGMSRLARASVTILCGGRDARARRSTLGGVPRPLRVNVPNGVYHVTSRGNRRQILFINDLDRELFLGLFATISALRGWKCHGYCLMPNHYHLVLQTPNADLSAGMQRLNGE